MAFFFVLFIYVLLETLAEPFVTDQYAVDDDFAMVAVGLALVIGGILSTGMYVATTKLAKKYDERKIMIILGMIPIVVGTFLYLPFGNTDIIMSECENITEFTTTTLNPDGYIGSAYLHSELTQEHNDEYDFFYRSLRTSGVTQNCTLGCPPEQEWCNNVPMIPVTQLCIAYIITILGYPVVQALAQTIFSKMLGPKPQGLWMGILTGVGSLSRIAGPVFVSYVYTDYGTYWTFGTLAIGMLFSLIELLFLYKRLIPMNIPTGKKGIDNNIVEDKV